VRVAPRLEDLLSVKMARFASSVPVDAHVLLERVDKTGSPAAASIVRGPGRTWVRSYVKGPPGAPWKGQPVYRRPSA
jgi:hypothetical protein